MRVRTHLHIISPWFVLQPCSPACLMLTIIPLRCAGLPSKKANASEYADGAARARRGTTRTRPRHVRGGAGRGGVGLSARCSAASLSARLGGPPGFVA